MSGMPSKPDAYYHYLQAHHQTEHPVKSWQVDWASLYWMWGFVVAISLITILWIRQYRSTRQRGAGLYSTDTWSGYASELAGPASFFFIVFSVLVVTGAVVLIAGHLIWGQKF
jgi:hypothetical protein